MCYSEDQLMELSKVFKQYSFIVFVDEVCLGKTHAKENQSIAK
jgi:hypothetical protein